MVVLTRLGPPAEGVRHTQDRTAVFINEKSLGVGTLYISEARVSWVGHLGQGFSLEYPHIALHAVQKDPSVFPHENLYLIIDVRLVDSEGTPSPTSTPSASDNDDERVDADDDVDDDKGMTEIRFVPEDKSKLDEMFCAMSACQALHPDPADASDSQEGAEDECEDEGEDAAEEEGMFDDAEEDDEPQNGTGQDEPMEHDLGSH